MPEIICKICGKDCTEDDICFGCKNYICSECDEGDAPWGVHGWEAHDARFK